MGQRPDIPKHQLESVIPRAKHATGIDFTIADLARFAAAIRVGRGEFVRYASTRVSVWRQPHSNTFVTVFYSKKSKAVIAINPDEQETPQCRATT